MFRGPLSKNPVLVESRHINRARGRHKETPKRRTIAFMSDLQVTTCDESLSTGARVLQNNKTHVCDYVFSIPFFPNTALLIMSKGCPSRSARTATTAETRWRLASTLKTIPAALTTPFPSSFDYVPSYIYQYAQASCHLQRKFPGSSRPGADHRLQRIRSRRVCSLSLRPRRVDRPQI